MSADDYVVIRGDQVDVGDVILTSHTEWTVTGISTPLPHDARGMFLLYVTPERHKPIHTYPDSLWRVRQEHADA